MQISVLQMEVQLVLELCLKILKSFYFRFLCPWQICWFLHLFYRSNKCIPKCGVS